MTDKWRSRLRTAGAMTLLCWARMLVATTPFERWRDSLGMATGRTGSDGLKEARRAAEYVEWAAKLLPFETKCLPRAMALSWTLRRRGIKHAVVIAIRPVELRESADALHAWVEVQGEEILGDLPGPWIETLRLGA